MNPKSGTAGSPVTPTAPVAPVEADDADPGKAAEAKAEAAKTESGSLGSTETKPFKPQEVSTEEDEDDELAWIEVELIDEDDKPIPGVPYEVLMPDGKSLASGTLNADGWVRIEGFEEGNCKISFPTLDQDAWEFVESVGAKPATT